MVYSVNENQRFDSTQLTCLLRHDTEHILVLTHAHYTTLNSTQDVKTIVSPVIGFSYDLIDL